MSGHDDIDPTTGLPKELGIGQDLESQGITLTIRVDTRRYGKAMTLIEGFPDDRTAKRHAKALKGSLATGGTVKDGRIELQGDHVDGARTYLEDQGFLVG